MYIAVIGIDRYRAWSPLHNAVADARGALNAFSQLGFEQVRAPLLDDAATGDALRHLVTDELGALRMNDSLVVFFAGHGHTETTTFPDGTCVKKGYLMPVDAEPRGGRIGTWLRLDSWLSELAQLRPMHILVVLDACHSGIALDPVIRWRGKEARLAEPLAQLAARRSRRIITSALDGQLAMDSGPKTGHSLFTGCLIDALTGGVFASLGRPVATGSEVWSHVRGRVIDYPSSKQTPDFGAFQLDDRGELIVSLTGREAPPRQGHDKVDSRPLPEPVAVPATMRRNTRSRLGGRRAPEPRQHNAADPGREATARDDGRTPPPQAPSLDAAFSAALDRQDAERRRGGNVLSIVAGDPSTALTGWAAWAAGRGCLTLVTEGTGFDAAIGDLLAQTPWLRALPAARARLAAAADLDVEAVDAALDARSGEERTAWIDDVAGIDQRARVSGWLLSALREPWAHVPDLGTAPVQGGELLSIVFELAAPIAVLVHHPEPAAGWLKRAIRTAAALVGYLPRHAVAVGAPSELVTRVLGEDRESAAMSMARQGVVPIATRVQPSPGHARSRAERILHDALARDPRTTGLFELNVQVPIHERERAVEVDLVAKAALLAVEIDGWYHFRDPQGYRRDRVKDVWLQRAGFFVMRFLAEDVEQRLALIVDEIALGLGGRRAAGPFPESHL